MSEIAGRLGGRRDDVPAEERAGPAGISPATGRWLRRRLAGGVTAVTTLTDRGYRAATVSGALLASTSPLQVAISVERESQMEEWIRESGVFAVSILPWRQKLLADRFAGLAPLPSATFADIDHFTAETGCPIVRQSLGWADCTVESDVVTGDHRLFVGAALAAGPGEAATDPPLVYFDNRYLRTD